MAVPAGFAPIQNLSVNGQFVDVFGVVVDFLAPVPTAGTDWQCTFNLADERSAFEGQRVKIFAKRDNMPPIRGTGDAVILRQIQLKPYRGSNILLSNFRTAWTVFHLDDIPEKQPTGNEVNIPYKVTRNGQKPTKDDMLYAIELTNIQPRYNWLSTAPAEAPSGVPEPIPIAPFREKFSLLADIGANKYFDLIGQVVKMFSTGDRLDLYITDYTENALLYDYSSNDAGGDDAGRDGDEYAYISSVKKNQQWKGPSGKYTLTVTLFWPHVSFAQNKVRESDFVLLRNVHIKLGKNGSCRLEGALHTDRKFPERVDIEKVSAENDDRVKDLLRRKRCFSKESSTSSSGVGQKRTRHESIAFEDMSHTQRKKVRRRQRDAETQGVVPENTATSKASPQAKPRSLTGKPTLLEANPQIACSHPNRPTRTIIDINDTAKSHTYTSPDGLQVPLPFVNQLFRAKVRVVDFQPADLAEFAVRTSEFDSISDAEDDDSPALSDSTSPSPSPPPANEDEGDDAVECRKRWTWFFTLIVQDAHDNGPKGHKDRIAIHIADEDAEFLLGMDAVNLRKASNASVLAQLREKLFLLWGDLEERKMEAVMARRQALATKDRNSQVRTAAQEKQDAHSERVNLRRSSSRPFVCCVKEYGVERSKGVWKRRFRMFGTNIR